MLSSDHEEDEDGDSDGCEVVEAEPAVAPVRGGRGGRAAAGKGRAAAKVHCAVAHNGSCD